MKQFKKNNNNQINLLIIATTATITEKAASKFRVRLSNSSFIVLKNFS